MKKLALAVAFAGAATAATAGSMAPPVMEMTPAPVVEQTSSSSAGGWVVPLILLALVAAAVANKG